MADFLIGAATAAHQVEGNNRHSDYWIMENIRHSDFAEPSGLACDHYNRYDEDIRLLAESGCNAYRFGIEWARIEPEEGRFDRDEITHYRRVLDCCHKNGVTPVVTLMHFSSPAWLISKGGWGNRDVAGYFSRYARFVAEQLGDSLPRICTINEANMGIQLHKVIQDMMKAGRRSEGGVQVGQSSGLDVKSILIGMLEQGRAFHTSPLKINSFLRPRSEKTERFVMEAHIAAKKQIKEVLPETKVGLTLSLFDYQPTKAGKDAAVKLWKEDFGWYLPFIRDDDFLGVQNYSRKIVDENGAREPAANAPLTQMGYEDYPRSIGNVLKRVARHFPGELIVTENGIATSDDERRCAFIREAVASVMEAKEHGIPVTGYLHWSLLDNFEWQAGFGKTFGLIAVDRTTQTRYPKNSLKVLGGLAEEFTGAQIVNSLRSDSTVFAHSTSFVHEEVLRLVQIV